MANVAVLSAPRRGRARLSVPGLRHQPGLALQLRDRLGGDDRVRQVRPSTVTGNMLVIFDAGRISLDELRQRVAREAGGYRPRKGSPAAESRGVDLLPAGDGTAWHTRAASDVIRSLNKTPAIGLSKEESERRLLASGPNR